MGIVHVIFFPSDQLLLSLSLSSLSSFSLSPLFPKIVPSHHLLGLRPLHMPRNPFTKSHVVGQWWTRLYARHLPFALVGLICIFRFQRASFPAKLDVSKLNVPSPSRRYPSLLVKLTGVLAHYHMGVVAFWPFCGQTGVNYDMGLPKN